MTDVVSTWLAVALGTGPGSAALLQGPEPDPALVAERLLPTGQSPGEELPATVHALLAEAGWDPSRLNRLVLTSGPGSYTGLRVGFALMKGIALAGRLPLEIVHTAEARALQSMLALSSPWPNRIRVVTALTTERFVISSFALEGDRLTLEEELSHPRREAEPLLRNTEDRVLLDTKAAALLPALPGALTLEASASRLPWALSRARRVDRGEGAEGLARLAPLYVTAAAD